jgi:hypothetical protein
MTIRMGKMSKAIDDAAEVIVVVGRQRIAKPVETDRAEERVRLGGPP